MFKNFETNKTKFLILSYPYERWKKDGCLPFRFWGLRTDGGAPWTINLLDKIFLFFQTILNLLRNIIIMMNLYIFLFDY